MYFLVPAQVGLISALDSSHHLHNGMNRSCEATIYPVLDKPRNSEALERRGTLLKEICPLVFKFPIAIRLDHR
jgi:hypothetical protein